MEKWEIRTPLPQKPGIRIGPCVNIIMESDLNPLSSSIILIKYADDTNLLVSEHTDSNLNQEFTHICDWAQQNKMRINITIRQMSYVFHRPHPSKFDMPCALDGIIQEHVAKLIGVFFSDKLGFEDHVNFVLTVCSQRTYLLKLLKSQGLPPKQLQTVFTYTALIFSQITYAISVWGGHFTSEQRQRTNAFLKQARKSEFTESIYCIEELLEKSDTKLFGRLTNPAHCLHPILSSNNKSHEFLLKKEGIHLSSFISPSSIK